MCSATASTSPRAWKPSPTSAGSACRAAVRDQVRDRLPVGFEDMGEQSVRNIARPIQCYRVRFDGAAVTVRPAHCRKAVAGFQPSHGRACCFRRHCRLARRRDRIGFIAARMRPPSQRAIPQIVKADEREGRARGCRSLSSPSATSAVRPDQDYFADGLTDDITTDLSRIAGSFVISRNTAFTFKGASQTMARHGRDLRRPLRSRRHVSGAAASRSGSTPEPDRRRDRRPDCGATGSTTTSATSRPSRTR